MELDKTNSLGASFSFILGWRASNSNASTQMWLVQGFVYVLALSVEGSQLIYYISEHKGLQMQFTVGKGRDVIHDTAMIGNLNMD